MKQPFWNVSPKQPSSPTWTISQPYAGKSFSLAGMSPNGKYFVAYTKTSTNYPCLRLYNIETRSFVSEWRWGTNDPYQVFAPLGCYVANNGWYSFNEIIYTPSTYFGNYKIINGPAATLYWQLNDGYSYSPGISVWNDDGTRLWRGNTEYNGDTSLYLNVPSKTTIRTLTATSTLVAKFSPDGLTYGLVPRSGNSGTATFYDSVTGSQIASFNQPLGTTVYAINSQKMWMSDSLEIWSLNNSPVKLGTPTPPSGFNLRGAFRNLMWTIRSNSTSTIMQDSFSSNFVTILPVGNSIYPQIEFDEAGSTMVTSYNDTIYVY